MLPRFANFFPMHHHQRQFDTKCRAASFTVTRDVHRPAVHFDNVSHNREAKPQASCGSCTSGQLLDDARLLLRGGKQPRSLTIATGDFRPLQVLAHNPVIR
jgi:hypothetical protein